ncbi:MAG: HAD family hydrolase [Crenarchaeota archaeon]|nr:HAD family hydrolase [Thermoproteota archaeon]
MNQWFEVLNPSFNSMVGHIKYVLIDFDGTISVIRQGWEGVMIPLMIEMSCEGNRPTPEIEKEVREYVDYSTGILTIRQMEWLAEAVRRYGISKNPKDAYEYKRIYNQRMLLLVEERLRKLVNGELNPDDLMICGSRRFLEELCKKGVTMYLASGTDHEHVLREANALGITKYFRGGIYGALDYTEENSKEKIIERILSENNLHGRELLVVGDGPVEVRSAKARGSIALGVASDEVRRIGLNPRKRKRLMDAGADAIIPDFTKTEELMMLLGFHA